MSYIDVHSNRAFYIKLLSIETTASILYHICQRLCLMFYNRAIKTISPFEMKRWSVTILRRLPRWRLARHKACELWLSSLFFTGYTGPDT